MQPSTPPRRLFSIAQRLALLITATVIIVLAMSLALTYGALTRSAEAEVSQRLAGAAVTLSEFGRQVQVRADAAMDSLASDSTVRHALAVDGAGLPDAVARAEKAMATFRLPTEPNAPIELWTTSGRRIASVGADVTDSLPRAPRSDSLGQVMTAAIRTVPRPGIMALPMPDSVAVGELYEQNGESYYWTVAAVHDGGPVLGYVAQRARYVIPPDVELRISNLIGEQVTLYAHNNSDDLWVAPSGARATPRFRRREVKPLRDWSRSGDSARSTDAFVYDGPDQQVLGVEIAGGARPWGTLMETPLSAVHLHARQPLVTIAGLGILLAMLSAIASVIVGRRIAKPLDQLTLAAEAMSQGEYAHRIDERRADEIGRLSAAFNQMAAEVDGSRQELVRRFEEERAAAEALERSNEQLRVANASAEQMREEAQHANRAKSDFLAVMSHELRTPLNAIGGYTQLLDLGIHGPITEAQHTALTRIARSQAHLLRLINDVLNFARVDAGQVRYSFRDVGIDETLSCVEPLVSPQMQAKRLSFDYQRCDPLLTVFADSDKLQQILLNLLSNAIKFTPEGGDIAVICNHDDDHVHIGVRDTGVGIPPDRVSAIFDPFVQLERSATQPADGVGLGLAISRDLARGMHGDLSATSVPGKGSTFTVSLPTRAAAPATETAATPVGVA